MISDHVIREADRLGVNPAVAQGVLDTESGGVGFNADGSLKIRFEPHIFDPKGEFRDYFSWERGRYDSQMYRRTLGDEWRNIHASQRNEHDALSVAADLGGVDRALRSASMGSAQIMGFNHKAAGYPDAEAMYDDFAESEEAQVRGLFNYIESHKLVDELRNRDWQGFTRGYNGSGLVDIYSARLAANVARREQEIS